MLNGHTADITRRAVKPLCVQLLSVTASCGCSFKAIYSASTVKWIDGHIKVRAKNSLLALLYSYACTRVAPSVMRPDGRSCLQAGNATVSSTDRRQKAEGERQIDRQRDVGGNRGVALYVDACVVNV